MDNHRNSTSSQYSNSSSNSGYASSTSQTMMSREPLTQHDELIRYIREAWTKVNKQKLRKQVCNLKSAEPNSFLNEQNQNLYQDAINSYRYRLK